MLISFIIINYKTKELSAQCLESIFDNCRGGHYEIIMIDNNSEDGSVKYLEQKYQNKITFIKSDSNLGFAGANNLGAKQAKGEILLFLNSDTVLKQDITAGISEAFENNKQLGIASPRLLNEDSSPQAKAYGKMPDLKSIITSKISQKELPIEKIAWVSGAALAIRKNLFEKIGAWDEKFFMYLEDVDLCYRAKLTGYEIKLLPEISIIHLGGKSPINDLKRRLIYFNSQDYFFKKHYGKIKTLFMKIIRWPYKKFVLRKLK